MSFADNIFGSYTRNNQKRIREMVKEVKAKVNSYKGSSITSSEIKKRSISLMNDIRSGKSSIEDKLIDAVALCYLATERSIGVSLYDVQLEAALAMREGAIAEVKTGEGKTFIQIIEAYLKGKDVSNIKPNDNYEKTITCSNTVSIILIFNNQFIIYI